MGKLKLSEMTEAQRNRIQAQNRAAKKRQKAERKRIDIRIAKLTRFGNFQDRKVV